MVQIIQDSEEFKDNLMQAFRRELEQLKQEYQPKQPTQYLTRAEVAKLLQIDLSTLHAWTKKGKLNPYGIGNRVYYKRQEVEAALKPLNK